MTGGDHSLAGAGAPAALGSTRVLAEFPASANQQHIWRREQAGGHGAAFNVAICRCLNGTVSDRAIAEAIRLLVARHEILRIRFVEDAAGALIQQVHEAGAVKLDVVDLRPLPAQVREDERCRLGESQARAPFDLAGNGSGQPLLRALLVRMSADRAYLYLTFHSLVIDGWSLDLVGREIGLLAQAIDAGTEPGLAPVDLQFGDFAQWQHDTIASGALDHEARFWRGELADLPSFTLPPDRPGAPRGGASEIRSRMIPRPLSDGFEHWARQHDLTLFSAACTAAARALQSLTGAAEVVFGTQVAGRADPASEAIVGPVGNEVLLRLPLKPGQSFAQAAGAVHARVGRAMAHAMLPFAALAAQRGDASPPCRVNFTLQRTYISSASVEDRQYGQFRLESVPGPSVGTTGDLTLFMVGRAAGWRLSCEFCPARYDAATIDRLLEGWLSEIAGVAAQPSPIVTTAPAPAPDNPRIAELRQRVVCLQPDGAGTPVLALNNASVLYPVARAIGTDNPFFDLHLCPSNSPLALPRRHFTDHARDAVEMIRLARPHGPYVLMGLCVCGALAVEAARLLRAEGETVELVALVDTYRPGYRERLGRFDRMVRRWQVAVMSTRRLLRRRRSGELSLAQVLGNYRALRHPLMRALLARLLGPAATPATAALTDQNRWFTEQVLLPSQAGLDMQPYDGKVIVLRSEEAPTGRLFPRDFGWTGFVPDPVEIVMVPGTHDTIFRPAGAAVIARAIRQAAG